MNTRRLKWKIWSKSILFAVVAGCSLLSIDAVQSAQEIGHVKEDGIRHVSALEAAQLIRLRSDMIILDVRTPSEFNQGHIKGAINIDYYSKNFKTQLGALDKKASYLIHCRSGARSGRTLPMPRSAGVLDVTHMDHGMNGWKAAKLPVTR